MSQRSSDVGGRPRIRDDFRNHLYGRRFESFTCLTMCRKQTLDLPAQLFVVSALFVEKWRALIRRHLEGSIKYLLHLLPTFRAFHRHCLSLGTARLSLCSILA